jgi:hypothetical protein
MSYTETLDTLKNAYTDALSRYGIKSDEAARTYKAYKDYELIKKIDPRGVRVGRYDKDDGQAARMIAAIQTRLDREQEQRERLIPKPVPQEAEKNTMDDLFKHVQENGRYQYLETPREVADSRGEYHFTDIHTLHTAADLTADKLFADDISRQQIDLSSSPFWATVWSDAELGVAENIIPIKNTYDLINMYDRFYDRYGVSGHEIDAYLQDIPFPDAALYEAEKEQNTMSDETNEAGEGFKEQPAPEQEAALGPGEPAEQEAPNETENGMTPEDKVMNKLFDQVRENGHYQYLKTSGEVADDYGNYSYQDIHTLHTAADLMADKRFAGGLSNYFAFFAETDLSSSPFWATVWTNNLTEQYGSLENIVPIKNGNDFFDMYDSFYNRYEISGYEIMANLQDIITLPEPEQKTASYEAENDISKEQNTMSDEINEETGEGFEEQPAPEQEAAFGPGEPAEQEAPNEAEGLGQEPRERPSPDEIAFRTALKMRTQIAESLQNGSLPCLPGADGIADTKPAVNLITGTRYHGANLLCLKDFQKRNGFPTAEYATQDAIQKSGIPIRAGESGIMISFAEKNKQTGDWENKNVRLFNVAQTAKPWAFKTYAEKVSQEKEREQEAFFKSQYGDKYQPREKTEQKPGPDITCSSTEPERYLSQYLAAVSMGSAFKATHQQATEFSQKLNNRLYEPVENGYPDPFKLSKICKEASVQCKEIIKEIKQPQQKQDQTQQHSRHM